MKIPGGWKPASEQPYGVEITTVDGVFIEQMAIPRAGTVVLQHSHVWDHTSMLAKGRVSVYKENQLDREYVAPAAIFIAAGIKHSFISNEDDTIIYCVHNLKSQDKVALLSEHDLLEEV